ncbi:MAG: nickel pincer cofactor biosynthesis protein LarC [Eubacteriales bacterium]|nr:nickel pincer cofactor biosynthesis protein LarC [Eubacteriales bacterium]
MKKHGLLYFDCASGISGDMTLGALLDLGLDEKEFLKQLDMLNLDGYRVEISEVEKNGIRAKHVDVIVEGEDNHETGHHYEHIHGHEEHHETDHHDENARDVHIHSHPHRNFADIRKIIEESALHEEVKEMALRIFGRVAAAEAKVHGKTVDEVHFHEVGAVDSIVDVAGCAILIHMLKPAGVYSSVVHEGYGYIRCQHGLLSVPVPATSEIFAASDAVLKQIDVEGELVTPTGAAIISELAESFGTMPQMKLKKTGWGAGTKDLPVPNVLKVYWGETEEKEDPAKSCIQTDEIMVLETNLDDCTGEMLGYAMEKILEAGALDVSYDPVFMKKNRPAYRMTVLSRPEDSEKMEKLMFQCTTTIGIRKHREERSILKRESVWKKTSWGACKGKQVMVGRENRVYPEYEDAVKLAEANDVSLWEIYRSYGE